ncbi:uncharacterized protein HGUI_00979 [Hanseniaspora guilliermondii]|uniref:Ribosome quality control complex subunit 2 n=1 Tax=Hanseniaspora guilliermondii TaxID=56406 RepID=A0A1L0B1D3_9ASCO|nr:uncharacterized protein HGUI_00979 [Hanseniaspora guilliermondii]
MKEKLTALDLELLVNELEESLVGLRLNNIYNIQDAHKQFLFKFQKPDVKQNLVIDNGLKLYITKYTRNTPPAPSGFIVKMRNYLSNKKLTGLKKIPNERIIVLQFSNGMFYLSLEFFSSGNLIVMDENLKILQVFRVNEEHGIHIGGYYNLFNPLELFKEESSMTERNSFEDYLKDDLSKMNISYIKDMFEAEKEKVNLYENKNNKKFKVLSISKLLYLNYPTLTNQLIQDRLKQRGYKVNEPCTNFLDSDDGVINKILEVLNDCVKNIEDVLKSPKDERKGFLTKIQNPSFLESEPENKESNPKFLYDSYSPFITSSIDYDVISNGYVNAIDTFYSTLEVLKISTKTNNFISQQNKKLDQAKQENLERLRQLEQASHSNEAKGNAIIANVAVIDELIETMNRLIYENQMDWKAAELWIRSQQKKKGKQSKNIKKIRLPLKLEENKFTVVLPLVDSYEDSYLDSDSDSDSDLESFSDSDSEPSTKEKKMISMTIDFSKSAYTNASIYFSLKKEVESKKSKTLTNQKKAIKSIENKFNKNLNKKMNQETTPNITRLSENFFFQKFHWFITTDGYLCILLNDDNIYWKYAEADDFYLTCESSLANKNSKVLIKNLRKEENLSERAILEASQYCLAASDAWNKKINGSSCLYCKISNVSKFVDDDFKKNGVLENAKFFIKDEEKLIRTSPVQIVMGFGLMWRKKAKGDSKEYVEYPAEVDNDEKISSYNNVLIASGEDSNILEVVEVENQKETEDSFDDENVENETSHSKTIANIFDEYDKQVETSKSASKKLKKKLEKKNNSKINAISEDSYKRQERAKQLEEKAKFQQQRVIKLMNAPKPIVHYDMMLKEISCSLKLSNIPEEDELFDYDIVPMFAPWMALSKCKFKIKILNGSNKKMKNCHDIMIYFERHMKLDLESKDKERIWPIESERIKDYPVESLVTCFFVDKFKCSLPGSNVVSNGGGKGSKNKSQKNKGKRK